MKIYVEAFKAILPVGSLSSLDWKDIEKPNIANSAYRCIEPDYKNHLNPKLLRRMSRIVKMGVTCAAEALKTANLSNPDAILVGTGLGCVDDTTVFLNQLTNNHEELLNPTAFIQSTHNTVSGQIALLLQAKCYNLTFTQKRFSFESSLLESIMILETHPNHQVLTGSLDELTEEAHTLLQKAGCAKKSEDDNTGFYPGEGAAFFVLSSQSNNNSPYLAGFSHTYGLSSEEMTIEHIIRFLADNGMDVADVDALLIGTNGDKHYDKGFGYANKAPFSQLKSIRFKEFCGEYDSASAFALWLACSSLSDAQSELKTILIHNKGQNGGDSFILIKR
jgi:hypothetical protein